MYAVDKTVKAHSGAVIGGDNWRYSKDEPERFWKDGLFRWDKIPGEDEKKLKILLNSALFTLKINTFLDPLKSSFSLKPIINWDYSPITKENNNLIKVGPVKVPQNSPRSFGGQATVTAEFLISHPTTDFLYLEVYYKYTPTSAKHVLAKASFHIDRKDTGEINILFKPLHGEINTAYPTVLQQVDSYKYPIKPKDVNLVLVNGCINDVGAFLIASPFSQFFDISFRAVNFCYYDMKQLLNNIVEKFPNAKIIVTGYWQGVSKNSNIEPIIDHLFLYIHAITTTACSVFAGPLCSFLVAAITEWFVKPFSKYLVKIKMDANWKLWKESANTNLDRAVSDINRERPCSACPFNGERISLAIPDIRPENAIFTVKSNVFGFEIKEVGWKYLKSPLVYYLKTGKLPITPIDSVASTRKSFCENPGDAAIGINAFSATTCPIASAFHPNPEGEWKYVEAIIKLLPSKWENRNTFEDIGAKFDPDRMRKK
jgi:hypothetical protein